MAKFKQLKLDNETFEKCLTAIRKIASSELWLDSFIQQSQKENRITSSMNVLLHWWQSIKDTDVNWEYEAIYQERPEYYYENYRGLLLHIAEDPYTRKSKVYHSYGVPDSIVEKLNDCNRDELYDKLETYVFDKVIGFDDCELKISENLK